MWLGRCKGSQEPVALKLLDLDSLNCDLVRTVGAAMHSCAHWASWVWSLCWGSSCDGCLQEVIIKETQTMHDQRHPHLLPLYASFVSFNHLWMVMPYVAGGSVMDIIQASFQEVR